MCGIAGRVNFRTERPVAESMVRAMCDLIAHRGPDADGVRVEGHAGFGHRRLAIIDLSPAGRQPMTSDDGRWWITFNGEIYNFQSLRQELESTGWRFRTKTDTEVLLAAYRAFGPACLDKLRGMFAFGIWDTVDRTLFLARDRLGKKPLAYRMDADGIAFASEPKAFLADPSFVPEPNLAAVSDYLTYQYVPSPDSAFVGVEKLPPAHYMIIDGRGTVTVRRYWRLEYEPKQTIGEDEACEQLRERLSDAVRVRLVSDVPLGAFLSGGVDSGTIVALMARLGSGPVKTFSIGFDEKEYDELHYARMVAERYGTEHHEFVVRPDAVAIFPNLVWHYGEPYADESAIPTYYLSELTRRHVTVALNGDAGDENFAGYRRYLPQPSFDRVAALPGPVRQALRGASGLLPAAGRSDGVAAKARRWLEIALDSREGRYARRLQHFYPSLKAALVTPDFVAASRGRDSMAPTLAAFEAAGARQFLDACLSVDVAHYLPDCLLVKVDIATMAHGLEGRSPLLDHEFMEWAATLPADLKLRGTTGKYLLKKAAAPLLPAEILHRPKMGFGVPLDRWFQGALLPFARDLLLDARARGRGYFDPRTVSRLLDEHQQGVRRWHDQIFNLVMLEQWFRMFIDRRPAGAPAAPVSGLAVA